MPYRIIRTYPAMPDRLDELVDLHKHCFTPGTALPDFMEGSWWVVVNEKDKLGGFAGLSYDVDALSTHAYLIRVGLLPPCQGKGFGKRLIRVRERKARKLGFKGLVTYTTADAYASANNLIDCGFHLFKPTILWGFKRDCNYWIKDF